MSYQKEERWSGEAPDERKEFFCSREALWGLVAFLAVLTVKLLHQRATSHICFDIYLLSLFYFIVLGVFVARTIIVRKTEWLPLAVGAGCMAAGLTSQLSPEGCKVETHNGWYILRPTPDCPENYWIFQTNSGMRVEGIRGKGGGIPLPFPVLHGIGRVIFPGKHYAFGHVEISSRGIELTDGMIFVSDGTAFVGNVVKNHYMGRMYSPRGRICDYEEKNNRTIREEYLSACRNTYLGFFRADSKTGYGRYYYHGGGYYEGWFRDGKCHGEGRLVDRNNKVIRHQQWCMEPPAGKPLTIMRALEVAQRIRNEWKRAGKYRHTLPLTAAALERHGVVIRSAQAGSNPAGTFCICPDAPAPCIVKYQGQLNGRRPEGEGTAVFETGDTYTGAWHNGLREGHGEMLYANGDKYEGEWKAGRRTGKGIYIKSLKPRTHVQGDFVDGLPHGIAICYTNGRIAYNGRWVDGRPLHPEKISREESPARREALPPRRASRGAR
ncbi:MAG: hypothetical protein K2N13_10680 [Paraprevotella sp.]|nr:hypothetical protein [Paraprevotella sp.]